MSVVKRLFRAISTSSTEGSESMRIRALIEEDDRALRYDEVQELKAASMTFQPVGYSEAQQKVRDLYRNDQAHWVQKALQKRFSSTWPQFPITSMNILKAHAGMASMSYRGPVRRQAKIDGWCIDLGMGDGVALKGGEARDVDPMWRRIQGQVDYIAEAAKLDLVMPELERRTNASGTHFARVTYVEPAPNSRRKPKYSISTHWPADVWVVPDDNHPSDLCRCVALVAAMAGGIYEAWTRSESGWWIDRFSAHGVFISRTHYDGKILPWVVMHNEYSDTIYRHDRSEVADTQDMVNVALSSHWLKDDIQGYGQLYTSGADKREGTTMISGPRTVLTFPRDTTVGVLNTQHDLTTLQGAEKHLAMQAIASRQSPEAWSTSPGASMSGWARVLENMPALERRKEDVNLYQTMEEEQLWPILLEQHDLFEPAGVKAIGTEVEVKVTLPDPPDYEEPAQKLSRVVVALNAKLITYRRAAIEAGLYATTEEAARAGIADELAAEPIDIPGTDNKLRGASDIGIRDGTVSSDVATTEAEPTTTTAPVAPAEEITANELSLAIERLARIGDMELVNDLRGALAKKLGRPAPSPLSEADITASVEEIATAEEGGADDSAG